MSEVTEAWKISIWYSKRLVAEYETWIRSFKSWREHCGTYVVPTSLIDSFLSRTVFSLSNVDPYPSSSIWKAKQCVRCCMQEICVTLIPVFIYNAIFIADNISDWTNNQQVWRQEAVELWWNALIVWSLVSALLQFPALFVNVKLK
jgi:hypothetical protein